MSLFLLLLSALRELKECSSCKWSSGLGLATAALSEAWEQRAAELKERLTQLPLQVSQTRGLREHQSQGFQTDRKFQSGKSQDPGGRGRRD